jgi:hypothetical protein
MIILCGLFSAVLHSKLQCSALMLYMYTWALCAYVLHIVGWGMGSSSKGAALGVSE